MADKTPCPIPEIRELTAAEIEILDGATLSTDELNLLDGVTATTDEINLNDGQTATAAEVNLAADVSAFLATYTVTAPAAIPATVRVIELNHIDTTIAKTIATLAAYAGQILVIKDISASGTAAHTVTAAAGTFDGTNDIATLNAPKECLIVAVDSAGNGTIVENVGAVGLSAS